MTNEARTVAQPSRCANGDVRLLPSSRITAAPNAGSAMITHSRWKTPLAAVGATTGEDSRSTDIAAFLVLQQARVVDRGRATRAEDGHDDRQPDDHLGRRHHHHKERRHLPVEV